MMDSYTILSVASIRFVCNGQEKVVPHAVFANVNDTFLFGAEAEAASRIWPNRLCGKVNSTMLAGLSELKRRMIISGFLVWAAAHTAGSGVRFLVLPMTMIHEYGPLFEALAQELGLNIRLITYLEMLMRIDGQSSGLRDGELGLYIYESYESAEAIFASSGEDGRLGLMQALYTPYMKRTGPFARNLKVLAERLPNGEGSLKQLKVWSNRSWEEALSPFKAEVTRFKVPTSDRLDRLEWRQQEESFQASFRRYDLFSRDSAERLRRRMPEGYPLADLVDEALRDYDALSHEQREFLHEGLHQSGEDTGEAEIDDEFRQGLMKMVLEKSGDKFKVGVVSPFSYGKSTLLNAFLGIPLLKDDIRAETANATHISRGKRRTLVLERGGASVLRRFESDEPMLQFLHEQTSVRESGDQVGRVHVALPTSELHEHIEWVDTPGLFGRHAHHDGITDRVIPELDLIVFLIDPKKVGHSRFGQKIEEYSRNNEKRSLFVIGKMDLYPEDGEKLIADLRESLPERLRHVPVFTVSGYWALKARMALNGIVPLEQLMKDPNIYAEIEGQYYSGRALMQEHVPVILEASGMVKLERYIRGVVKQSLERRRTNELNHIL